MRKRALFFSLTFLVTIQNVALPDAWALGSGGFSNQVVGLRTLGKGNSAVAYPDDATTVYMNPAGMPFLKGSEIETGATFEVLQFEHKSTSGVETQNEKSVITVPHAFATTGNTLNDRFSFGFGVAAPYGLMTEWDDQSFSKFHATVTELTIIEYNLVAAYKVTDHLAVALGGSYFDSNANLQKKVNVTAVNRDLGEGGAATGNVTGHQEIKADGYAWGYNAAIYYEPTENHHFGATFRGRVSTQYKGRLRITGLTSTASAAFGGGSTYETRTESKSTLPESVELGYAYTPPSKKWTWESDFAWTGWNVNEATTYEWPEESNTTRLLVLNAAGVNPFPRDWKSTISMGTGLEYHLCDWLDLRTGYVFYETPVPGDHFETSLPDANRHFFTNGFGIKKGNFRMDAAYVLIVPQTRSINNTVANGSDTSAIDGRASSLDGEYSGLHHLFGVNFAWVF